ncbi:MAG: phage tail protein [Deltaproteobacteria bacterium]|nr:phage tail protein [Deltaproteobacteria bacterium]
MSEPFLAEIKIAGFNFPPRGYAACDGQILPINQNQSLYSLLATTYGGDGRTSFALPELRGRTPIHEGDGFNLGNKSGQEGVSLTTGQIPSHEHGARATSESVSSINPSGKLLGVSQGSQFSITPYGDLTSPQQMASAALGNEGSGQPHPNMQPFTTLNFFIALQGLFPSRN